MRWPTSLLLGLEGLGVRSVVRRADRTRVVEVITTGPNASRCPDCGISSTSMKGYAVTTPRDIRYGDDPIILRWDKTRYRCRNETCERASFTEAPPGHLRRPRPAWPQTRPGVGQPPPTLDSARTSVAQSIRHDVERPDRQRPELSNPVGLHRQRGTAPTNFLPPPLTAPTTPRSAPGSTASTAGAPTPTSPNCTAWPPRSRPGGRPSWRSCTPD